LDIVFPPFSMFVAVIAILNSTIDKILQHMILFDG